MKWWTTSFVHHVDLIISPKTQTIIKNKKNKNYMTFLLQLDLYVPLKDWIKLNFDAVIRDDKFSIVVVRRNENGMGIS